MENIQNIADESSDDEGFEVDENDIVEHDVVSGEVEDYDASGEVYDEGSSSSSSSSSKYRRVTEIESSAADPDESEPASDSVSAEPDSEVDTIDFFAKSRKVPLSHQVDYTDGVIKALNKLC